MVDWRTEPWGSGYLRRLTLLYAVCLIAGSALASEIEYRHGFAFLSTPKYPADFEHFDYVNPDAPKGGRMRIAAMGSWDNFNPLSVPGGQMVAGLSVEAPHWNLLHDALVSQAADEPSTIYGRLAEGIAVANDGSWIAFKLRQNARWHDGKPITIDDVYFSYTVFTTVASPTVATPLEPIESFEVIGPWEIRFNIRESDRGDPLLPLRIGSKPILAKHYWESRDITKTTVEPPVGSGPYRIKDFRIGRSIRWERVDNYWGKDLSVMRGRFNFDELKWDYFRDDQVQTEALKGDVIDVHEENLPRLWETAYKFPPSDAGAFRKQWLPVEKPWGLWWPIFWNLDQPRFQDVRVREALWLVSDFPYLNWVNYDFYQTAESFFHGSELASRGLPDERELQYLEPIRHLVPPRVFSEPYRPPPNGGKGWHRDNLIKAAALLKQAGWIVEEGKLIHGQTRETFHVRLVAVSPALAGSFIPYMRNLERLGITATAKAPEISNWLFRMRSGDFDGGAIWFLPDYTPTHLIANNFSSATAEHEYGNNWSNMRDPAIDHLIECIKTAATYTDYVAAIRAFDRVMLWNFYFVPGMTKTRIGLAHWNRYNWVEAGNLTRPAHVQTWWFDRERASAVEKFQGR